MITPLHALLVAEAPAQPVLDSLRRAGYDPRPHYVTTPEALGAAWMQRSWDIVLVRHGLPNLSVWDALGSFQRKHAPVPCLVIADGLGEDEIIELVHAGATDIIRSSQLDRLSVSVAKALGRPRTADAPHGDADSAPTDPGVQALADHMPIGLYRSTEDGRVLYANPALARILGRDSVDELLGSDVVSTLSYPRESFVERIAADGAVHNLEACWQRESGETIYTRENTRAVRDANGDFLYYEGTMEDITDERTALLSEQQHVEQLEAIVRFSAAVDASQNGEELHLAIVRAVEETLHADAAVLVQGEDGRFEVRAWSEAISEENVRLCSDTEVWSSYPVHTQPLLLRDEQAASESSVVEPLRQFMREAGLRALGSFPLLHRGRPLGMVVAFFREPHTFTEGELRIAETLAWHIAVALSRWQAECELRDNEASLRTISDTTGHVLYRRRTDSEGYDYVSASIQKVTGYTATELQGMGGLDTLIVKKESVSGAALREGLFDGEEKQFSALYQIRTRGGALRWVEDCAYPWVDEAGHAVGLVGVLQDVTARYEREQAARALHLRGIAQQRAITELSTMDAEPEALLHRITEVTAQTVGTSRVGLWLMHGGADSMHHRDRYVLETEAHEPTTGFPLEAVMADSARMEECTTLKLNALTDAPSLKSPALEAYCVREEVAALMVAPVRRQGRCVGFMVLEQTGGPRLWTDDEQEFAEDVAALVSLLIEHIHRARAESALRGSELRYRAISELAADYAYSLRVGTEGLTKFEWATKAFERISGYTPDELGGVQGLIDIVHEDDRAFVEAELVRLKAGHTIDIEIRIVTKSGEHRWVSNRSRPVLDRDGRMVHVYSSGQDISDRKEFETELIVARERAEEMARLKSAFLANMSHEIRTPLTGILGFAGVLAEEVDDDHREFVQLIEKSGRRLLDTLNSVLDLAQLESDGMRIAASPLDIIDEAQQVVCLLNPLAEEKGIVLELDAEDESVIAPLDSTCLNRILHNLVGNAIKFTEAGRISVVVRAEDERVSLKVSDTGIGIDERFLPHLFDEFKQESTGQGRSHEGSGLGLAITRKLVELMGGTVGVESAKGEGSTFTIFFPRIVPPATGGDGQSTGVENGASERPESHSEHEAEEQSPAREEADVEETEAFTAEDELTLRTEMLFDSNLLDEVQGTFERDDYSKESFTLAAEIADEVLEPADVRKDEDSDDEETEGSPEAGVEAQKPDGPGPEEDVWWMNQDEADDAEPPPLPALEIDVDPEPGLDAKPSVLVVEDNDETRLLIGRVLRGEYEVETVADARTGLQRMADRTYDALVLDINLGGKQTGVDILRVARAIPGYEEIVAVALTAYALPGDSERFLAAGFDRYVSKPFTKRGLLDALAAGKRETVARS